MKENRFCILISVLLCTVLFVGCDPSVSPGIEKTPGITPGRGSSLASTPSPLPALKFTPEPTPEPTPESTEEPTPEPTPEPTEEPEITYIANENTGKFHYPDCFSVDRMKEYNKWYFDGTREELIDLGYKPCKKCCP